VIRLGKEREGKKFTDIVIERSYELLGCTPDEKSDENMKHLLIRQNLETDRIVCVLIIYSLLDESIKDKYV